MQFLKGIVIILGILIVIGVGLLSYGLIKKTTDPNWKFFSSSKKLKSEPAINAYPIINLNLPKDCKIINASPEGTKVFLSITGTSICNKVIVVDTLKGKIITTIKANP